MLPSATHWTQPMTKQTHQGRDMLLRDAWDVGCAGQTHHLMWDQ
jgi:hypothetical protein